MITSINHSSNKTINNNSMLIKAYKMMEASQMSKIKQIMAKLIKMDKNMAVRMKRTLLSKTRKSWLNQTKAFKNLGWEYQDQKDSKILEFKSNIDFSYCSYSQSDSSYHSPLFLSLTVLCLSFFFYFIAYKDIMLCSIYALFILVSINSQIH